MVKMCTMNFARVVLLLTFSSIGGNHANEQNNNIIKGDGAAIDGTSDHAEALSE